MAAYLPAAALLVVGLVGLAAGSLASAQDSGQYLVVAAPGSTLAETIALVRKAGGGFAATGYFSNVIVAGSTDAGFEVATRKAGAWLALPISPLAGCVAPATVEQTS
jgi:hypothetical protein